MKDERVNEIRATMENSTQGKWEWKGMVGPDWMPDTCMAVDDLRVQIATPDKETDYELWFVLQAMKSGFIMVRNADAHLIVNAPDWIHDLLTERETLHKAIDDVIVMSRSHDSSTTRVVMMRNALEAALKATGEG